MPKRRTPEERYKDNIRKQQAILEEFAAHEIEWADDLLMWYRIRKQEISDDDTGLWRSLKTGSIYTSPVH
jgi:hypothetical protein